MQICQHCCRFIPTVIRSVAWLFFFTWHRSISLCYSSSDAADHWNQQSDQSMSSCERHLQASKHFPPIKKKLKKKITSTVLKVLLLGSRVSSKIKQVWNVERAASPQRFDGELRWGKERRARASEQAHGDNDVGPGTRGDCTVKRETFCLRAEEGREEREERWGGHFSWRAHPFHSVFLGAPPGHHLPFPSSDYPSIYHYICGKKPSLTHIVIVSEHSHCKKGAAGFPWQPLEEVSGFLALPVCRFVK